MKLLAALALLALCLPARSAESVESAESVHDAGSAHVAESDLVVMRAMRDELDRAMQGLALARLERPYFLAYRIDDSTMLDARARFGALTAATVNRTRLLTVEVRVGDVDLDNTNFLPVRTWGTPLTRLFALPLEDDYQELRRQMWLATDVAYKHALETLAKKRAALQNNSREEVPDFAAQAPHISHVDMPADIPDIEDLKMLARDLAALFKEMPAIQDSVVGARVIQVRSRYVNSEGTSYAQSQPTVSLSALAKTQALDGTVLQDFEVFYARAWQDLPSRQILERRIRAMGAALSARRGAEFVELYNGPVLFEGQAAAALFAVHASHRAPPAGVAGASRGPADARLRRVAAQSLRR